MTALPAPPPGYGRQDIPALLAIFCSVLLVYLPTFGIGELWWTDESRHAMNGVFFHDFVQDFPWRAPYQYALQYFAQYPALALNWYPPFYYFVEAAFFGVLGISENVAHLSILFFALVGGFAWYAWVRRTWGRAVAVASFTLFIFMPGTLQWTRSVMLEIPALAMIMVSVLAFERYLERPTMGRSVSAGLILACTLLVKQTTVVILPALLGYAMLSGRGRQLKSSAALPAYGLVTIALAVLAVHAMKFGVVGLAATVGNLHESAQAAPPLLSLGRLAVVPGALWTVGGLALTGLGLFSAAWFRIRVPQDWLIVSWILSWYVIMTLVFHVPADAPRYTMYGMPAIALLIARLVMPNTLGPVLRKGLIVALSGMILWSGWKDWQTPHYFVQGYAEAAKFVMEEKDSGLILFMGKHDGDFILNIRALDQDKSKVILRGDKILTSVTIQKYFGTVSHVRNEQDILALLERYGIGTIVVENRDMIGVPEVPMLHHLLENGRFERIREIPVVTNVPWYSDLSIRVYRYLDYKPRPDAEIVIPLPMMGMEIKFKPKTPGAQH